MVTVSEQLGRFEHNRLGRALPQLLVEAALDPIYREMMMTTSKQICQFDHNQLGHALPQLLVEAVLDQI